MKNLDPFDLLRKAGLKPGKVGRIRLGGVVGKTTYAVVTMFGVLGIAAHGLSGLAIPLCFISIIAVAAFVFYIRQVMGFAKGNPGAAMLEGAELVQWLQLEMGAKDMPSLPQGPNTNPPPPIIDNQPQS